MTRLPYRPCPIVLAAPSGTGKTTIARRLVEQDERFVFSVSATTREPRGNEREGEDYHFVSDEEFGRMIDRDELAEWARVHGHWYGTPVANLGASADAGRHPVLDIDVQGARQIRERVPEALLIFVLPPDAEALHRRLSGRGTEGEPEARRRLGNAKEELRAASEFDYLVVNRELDEAVAAVKAIVEAEGHRPDRARDLAAEIDRLVAGIDRVLGNQ